MTRAGKKLSALGAMAVFCATSCDDARLIGPTLANFPRQVSIEKGLTYTQRESGPLQYDLYKPFPIDAPVPLVIMIHGGSWSSGDRQQFVEFAFDLAANGFACAPIDYRLLDEGGVFPGNVNDVLAAVDYFKAHAESMLVDSARIGLFGWSAGGHLALLAGMARDAGDFDASRPAGPAGVRAIVNLFGPTDFTVDPDEVSESQVRRVERLLGVSFEQAGELLAKASPVSYVRPDGPAVLTIHGDADSLVPVSQARILEDALKAAGQPAIYLEIPGMEHLVGAIWGLEYAQGFRSEIIEFLNGALKQ